MINKQTKNLDNHIVSRIDKKINWRTVQLKRKDERIIFLFSSIILQ